MFSFIGIHKASVVLRTQIIYFHVTSEADVSIILNWYNILHERIDFYAGLCCKNMESKFYS
jgi:hypothetical protein